MVAILRKNSPKQLLHSQFTNTPVKYITHAYQTAVYDKKEDTIRFKLIDELDSVLTRDIFVSALEGKQNAPTIPQVYDPSPSDAQISSFVEEIGFN